MLFTPSIISISFSLSNPDANRYPSTEHVYKPLRHSGLCVVIRRISVLNVSVGSRSQASAVLPTAPSLHPYSTHGEAGMRCLPFEDTVLKATKVPRFSIKRPDNHYPRVRHD
ncbi:hypothetical protein BU26DRAFT_137992 [Trematosphaeria pertusa]|uniref:Uncharacterized protein n=1 Tax=Trematosphaeria pertusa TaxID=390896 RepID=A0A6A6IVI5_9PLEO|nr:uncharacterized protein BU26DRAFT_137992 [Trematosphaeria pertusa]KAF2254434.1 hypothetical protein BU26DRAFT_137992 [Trematosphaeria pertusa]